jgi:putative ABC transport system permease protein
VVTQVALSLMMLALAGLFLRSLDKARRIDVGFDSSARVLAVSFDLGLLRYDRARADAFTGELLDRTRALPGVASVGATDLLPLTAWNSARVSALPVTGGAPTTDLPATFASAGPGYFTTIGTTLLAGRDFTAADGPGAPPVVVVSETFARRHLGGRSALGARVRMGGDRDGEEWRTVVGIARDAMLGSLGTPDVGAVYLPLGQRPSSGLTMLVRSTGPDATALGATVRGIIRAMDPALAVHRLATLDRVRDDSMALRRSGAAILAIFGVLALLLASVGLHGVLLFTVRQRTREIGIRMALGATTGAVTSLFVRRGMRLTAIGGAIGLALAIGATQLARSILFGVSPNDAFAFLGVSALFGGVALVACWLPARKAAGVDPVRAMRVE